MTDGGSESMIYRLLSGVTAPFCDKCYSFKKQEAETANVNVWYLIVAVNSKILSCSIHHCHSQHCWLQWKHCCKPDFYHCGNTPVYMKFYLVIFGSVTSSRERHDLVPLINVIRMLLERNTFNQFVYRFEIRCFIENRFFTSISRSVIVH